MSKFDEKDNDWEIVDAESEKTDVCNELSKAQDAVSWGDVINIGPDSNLKTALEKSTNENAVLVERLNFLERNLQQLSNELDVCKADKLRLTEECSRKQIIISNIRKEQEETEKSMSNSDKILLSSSRLIFQSSLTSQRLHTISRKMSSSSLKMSTIGSSSTIFIADDTSVEDDGFFDCNVSSTSDDTTIQTQHCINQLDRECESVESAWNGVQMRFIDALDLHVEQVKSAELSKTIQAIAQEKRKFDELNALYQSQLISGPTSTLSSPLMISIQDFQLNSLVLFFPTSSKNYLAFNINCPHYYLSNESKLLINNEEHFKTVYVLGRIVFMEPRQASKEANPFKLAVGTRFFIVTVTPISSRHGL